MSQTLAAMEGGSGDRGNQITAFCCVGRKVMIRPGWGQVTCRSLHMEDAMKKEEEY